MEFKLQRFADVIHGTSSGDYGSNIGDNTQVYGLAGNDTIETNNSKNVLLIGGSGNDVIQMTGGSGTLNGGAGADTFKFNYSSANTISAVIEDIDPVNDRLVINYTGSGTPNINYSTVGKDIVLTDDAGYFNVTLKGYREANDYFDGVANENVWEVLKIVNQERENQSLGQLILSQGLIDGASIRAVEIEDTWGHTRPDGTSCFTAVEKSYNNWGENIAAGYGSPEAVMVGWMNSTGHRANILRDYFTKLGVGYFYKSGSYYGDYWVQMFSSTLNETETVSTSAILSTKTTLTANGAPQSNSTLGNISGLKRTTVSGTASADLLVNGRWYGEKGTQNVEIHALGGNDTISNSGSNSVLDGGAGNDEIHNGYYYYDSGSYYEESYNSEYDDENGSSNVTISGGTGSDTIQNTGDAAIISGGNDSDSVSNIGDSVTVNGDSGNDFIINGRWYGEKGGVRVKLFGGTGSDTITNSGSNSVLDGGEGDDLIYNGYYFYANGSYYEKSYNGNYDDANGSSRVTIQGGAGNDEIHSRGTGSNIFLYNSSDGNDTVYGYSSSDTISITGGTYTKSTVGNNVIVSVGSGAMTLVDASGKTINIKGTETSTVPASTGVTLSNYYTNTLISGTSYADNIYNSGANVTINSGAGADRIDNVGSNVLISAGEGNDTLTGGGNKITINGDAGNDRLELWGTNSVINTGDGNNDVFIHNNNVTVNGGTGKDLVEIWDDYGGYPPSAVGKAKVFTGADNDFVRNYGAGATINTGAGNDTIQIISGYTYNGTRANVYQYAQGDGNDTILGYNSGDSIQIINGSYTTQTSGNDVIVSVGNGKLTLKDAKNTTLNIIGEAVSTVPAGISVSGAVLTATTAFTGSKIDLADYPTATKVNASALSRGVSIVGTAVANSLKGGKGADTIFGGAGADTVSLGAGNDIYVYASGNDYIQDYTADADKIKLASASITSASVSGSNVVLKTSSGNITVKGGKDKKITVIDKNGNETSNVYTLSTVPAGLSVNSSVLTASTAFTGSKIDLADYPAATKVNASALSRGVSIVGTAAANSLKGGKGADTILGGAGADTVSLGAGNDIYVYASGNDYIQDYTAGADKIKLASASITSASVSGSNVVLKTSGGNITVKGGKDKAITVIDKNGNETSNVYPLSTVPAGLSVSNSVLTASTAFTGSKIDLADYPTATKVNASALSRGVTIVGTAVANSLKGGKGADTIFGGAGADTVSLGAGNDIYVYASGNDYIQDYTAGADKIKLASASITSASVSGSNVVLKTSSGNITVKGGKDKAITVIDASGNETTGVYPLSTVSAGLSVNSSVLTATTAFTGSKIDLADYPAATKVNASALSRGVSIVGTAAANSLKGGKGADTIFGGAGKDTVSLGGGADVYVYASGDDLIQDYVAGTDKIKLASASITSASVSGSNVVLKTSSGNITVKGGKDKAITVIDASGNETTGVYPLDTMPVGLSYDSAKKKLTVASNYGGAAIDLADFATTKTVDASAFTKKIKITGNNLGNTILGGTGADTLTGGTKADTISGAAGADKLFGGAGNDTLIGGAGNDTLTGGDGKDVFIYGSGDGKDVIADYVAGDKIKISSGSISNTSYSGNNVVFTVGSGTLTVKDGKGKKITIVDTAGKTTTKTYNSGVSYGSNGNVAVPWYLKDDTNFVSDSANLDDISAEKFSVTDFEPTNYENPAAPQISLTAYSSDK